MDSRPRGRPVQGRGGQWVTPEGNAVEQIFGPFGSFVAKSRCASRVEIDAETVLKAHCLQDRYRRTLDK